MRIGGRGAAAINSATKAKVSRECAPGCGCRGTYRTCGEARWAEGHPSDSIRLADCGRTFLQYSSSAFTFAPTLACSADTRQGSVRWPRILRRRRGLFTGVLRVTDQFVDLKALLVEREEFEGSMVSKLREGLAQGASQVRALREINDILGKRIAAAAAPQQKKLHLKLGVVQFYLGHTQLAIDHLKQSDGPLAAFFLGRAYNLRGDYDDALKAFEKAEKTGYAVQQVQLQKAGVLRGQGDYTHAKQILVKLKDMAAHNAEYHYQEGGLAEAEGDTLRAVKG